MRITLLLLICSFKAFSQQFFFQAGAISDFDGVVKADTFYAQVQLDSQRINSSYGLSKVCINIYHERISDLKVELISPDKTSIWLTNRNGADTDYLYFNTCFKSNGFSGYIHQGKMPFTGEYIPDGRMSFINNGQNPNGTWKMLVTDLKEGKTGSLNIFSLLFENDPNPNFDTGTCSVENPENCDCASSGRQDCGLLPDLVVLEKFTDYQIKEYAWNDKEYPGQLRFAATIANIGDGPMETFGTNKWYCGDKEVKGSVLCPDGRYSRQTIHQRLYSKKAGKIVYKDVKAGTNYFDNKPGHNHFHVDDWIEFRLTQKVKKKYKTVTKGSKVSYCLFDTGICVTTDSLCYSQGKVFNEKNLKNFGFGNFPSCKEGVQGISVGGYDTYGMLYEGQYIDLPKNLKSGQYYLELDIDPKGKYAEKNKKNNLYRKAVTISMQEHNP